MPRVALEKPSPEFVLNDFKGEAVRLSDLKNQANVLLVFNRGFT